MTRTRSLADRLAAEILRPGAVPPVTAPWLDLETRALEPNAFQSPAAVTARLRHLPEGRTARLVLAWRGDGEARRLVGSLLVVRPRRRDANPLGVMRAADLYAPLSAPLLDPDRPAETWAAMLDALAAAGIACLALPYVGTDGPVFAALEQVAAATARPLIRSNEHRRAFLSSRLGGQAYLRTTFDQKRLRDFERKRRRLAEGGALSFAVADEPGSAVRAVDAFLTIESAGWKGRAGTDLASVPGAGPFLRDLARDGARSGAVRLYTLCVADRPVAAGYVMVSGRNAFYVKTAYDETLSSLSPGFLLTLDITAALLDDPEVETADSVAVADHSMIDKVWTDRLSVASVLVATRPGGGALFRAAVAWERWREDLVARLKRWRAFRGRTGRPTRPSVQ